MESKESPMADFTTIKVNKKEYERIESALADAKREAESLAVFLWKKHYEKDAPHWGLCNSVAGVISQIDNMVAGVHSECDSLRTELSRLTLSAAESQREVEMLMAERDLFKKEAVALAKDALRYKPVLERIAGFDRICHGFKECNCPACIAADAVRQP